MSKRLPYNVPVGRVIHRTEPTKPRVTDIQEDIQQTQVLINYHRSLINNHTGNVKEIQDQIDQLQMKLVEVVAKYNNAPARIEELETLLETQKKLLNLHAVQPKIDRFERLSGRLKALLAEANASGIDLSAYLNGTAEGP